MTSENTDGGMDGQLELSLIQEVISIKGKHIQVRKVSFILNFIPFMYLLLFPSCVSDFNICIFMYLLFR